MIRWVRKRIRESRRRKAVSLLSSAPPSAAGVITLAACHPEGLIESPCLATVFRADDLYSGMVDTEIRGFLDGGVKFRRNVATQYHVRIGCEGSKPQAGRYEVMRVLQRWDISALPLEAKVRAVRLVLCQEDITRFPHRHPPVWPVDFFLHDVRKPWGPGRGGEKRDNQSAPEPGDAWWLDARAGELPWKIPGCDHASDSDLEADRGAEPLAWTRLLVPGEDLVFAGPRLTEHVQSAIAAGAPLDLLIRAGRADETTPGTIRAFYSREYGDDGGPEQRPRLEVDWIAPCLWAMERPFVLEPGDRALFEPSAPLAPDRVGEVKEAVLAASLRLEAPTPGEAIQPRAFAHGVSARPLPLAVPGRALVGPGLRVEIKAAPQPVAAGEEVAIQLLETWSPDAGPGKLAIQFQLRAPSGRTLARRAEHVGELTYACRFRPDELGVWSYSWSSLPDRRFPPHHGGGCFTVVAADRETRRRALEEFARDAIREAGSARQILERRHSHRRLVALEREAARMLDGAGGEAELRLLLARIAEAMRRVG